MANLQGKAIAISGGASGIGLATAIYLSQRGASVSLADVQQAKLEEAAATIKKTAAPGVQVLTSPVDVRNRKSVDDWISTTVRVLGKLDGAANLAGVFSRAPNGIADMEDEDWDFVMGINVTGVMYCMRAQLRVISPGGSIVNASSFAGLMGSPNYPAYTASKHAVIGLSKCAAREAGGRDVRVNSICP